jgi:hypothetical protein
MHLYGTSAELCASHGSERDDVAKLYLQEVLSFLLIFLDGFALQLCLKELI